MNDILKTYMERFRENRHTLRRYTAFVLALAMITTLFVNWQLHGVGISMTAQYQCGEEEQHIALGGRFRFGHGLDLRAGAVHFDGGGGRYGLATCLVGDGGGVGQ